MFIFHYLISFNYRLICRCLTTMENTCSTDFSQSILDKFRSISKDNEEPKKSGVNGKKTDSPERSNENNCGHKRGTSSSEDRSGIKEVDVGISQYISKLDGFSGIIKHRYSDFQVNEIDQSGHVIELSSFELPVEQTAEESTDYKDKLSPTDWVKIEEIVNSDKENSEPLLIDVTEKSKEERTAIHLAVRKLHGTKVISNTKEVEEKKYIEVKKMVKKEGRVDWPRGRGKFLHCAVYKMNKDTTELINVLSFKLRMKSSLIGYAGTKDKRAKTTQRMSFKHKTAEAVSRIKIFGVSIGNFSYQDKEVMLGDSKGNRFRIAIRNVIASDELIEENMKSLRDKGFINYFGLQRFGRFSTVPTYAVGKALLASDWKSAVELILKPRPKSKGKSDVYLALQSWAKDKNAATAVKWLSRFDNCVEATVLRTLKSQGNTAYMNALMALPRNTMTMYLHSYQSLIWNRIVSKRIEKYGLKPLAGDLIVVEEAEENPPEDKGDEVDEEDEDEEEGNNDDKNEDQNSTKVTRKMKVRVITEEELDSISISDIVYPLAGHDIIYPNNEIKTWYEEILAESNFTFDNLNNTHKHFALGGAYRRFLTKLDDLSWKIVSFNDLDQDLILSDVDKLKNITLPETCDDGKYKAVILSFNLDSCCYATMALREIMKCDTSSHHHSQLTEQYTDSNSQQNKKQKT